MITLDDELARDYLAEAHEHLSSVETDLLALEESGAAFDDELVNRVFRAVHSVKGGAGFFDLAKVRELAHQMENVLSQIRSRVLLPAPDKVKVLLRAKDVLSQLLDRPETSNRVDTSEIMSALTGSCSAADPAPLRFAEAAPGAAPNPKGSLRVLLVEDDFASRLLLQTFLSRYGECHIAVNGREAVAAFESALISGEDYHLICMDIMMPEMDGREAVRRIRTLEESRGIHSTAGVKIFMTTAVGDVKEVSRCFMELCDTYLIKPIDLGTLSSHMRSYLLIP